MKYLKTFTIISVIIIAFIFGWNNLFISEENRAVAPFSAIYTFGLVDVYLKQDDKESVVVRADTNIMDQVLVEVVDGVLKIETKGTIRHERVIDVYVSYKAIDAVHASGASTLTGRGPVNTPYLKIKTSGAAEVKLQVAVDSLNLLMNDNANVQLAGTATHFNFTITNVGDLMAYNLVSQHCKALVDTGNQSPGIARINVEQTIDVTIKGPRHIKYKGDAEIIQQSIEVEGKLINY